MSEGRGRRPGDCLEMERRCGALAGTSAGSGGRPAEDWLCYYSVTPSIVEYLSLHVGHPVVGELDPFKTNGRLGVPELSQGRAGVVRECAWLLQRRVPATSYHPLGAETGK